MSPSDPGTSRSVATWPNVVLVLSGGNALGAFHAGAYEVLHEQGIRPRAVVGSSVGAIMAALIAGNPDDMRLARLRAFWDLVTQRIPPPLSTSPALKLLAAVQARVVGRPGLFDVVLPRLFEAMPVGAPALYRTRALGRTLAEFVDFATLPNQPCRLVITATDLMTGEGLVFRSDSDRIGPDHVRASAALPGDFEPVAIGGRVLGDGGLVANLPVEPALIPPPAEDTLCIALDLIDRRARRLATLDDMNQRRSDLLFASQADKDLELVRRRWELDAATGRRAGALLIAHVVYRGNDNEISQKAFDYSESSIAARWQAGRTAMAEALARIEQAGRPERVDIIECP